MIHHATRLIRDAFNDADLKFSVDEVDDRSYISAGFTIDNGPNVVVRFVSTDDDNDVAVRLFKIFNVADQSKLASVLLAVNECNEKYRYLKFVLDSDHDVNVEYDLPLKLTDADVGPCAVEIFIRIMKLMDDVYPVFMRALWT